MRFKKKHSLQNFMESFRNICGISNKYLGNIVESIPNMFGIMNKSEPLALNISKQFVYFVKFSQILP